eukprot:1160811-Pelagomonas_calceolata.AAC.10
MRVCCVESVLRRECAASRVYCVESVLQRALKGGKKGNAPGPAGAGAAAVGAGTAGEDHPRWGARVCGQLWDDGQAADALEGGISGSKGGGGRKTFFPRGIQMTVRLWAAPQDGGQAAGELEGGKLNEMHVSVHMWAAMGQ